MKTARRLESEKVPSIRYFTYSRHVLARFHGTRAAYTLVQLVASSVLVFCPLAAVVAYESVTGTQAHHVAVAVAMAAMAVGPMANGILFGVRNKVNGAQFGPKGYEWFSVTDCSTFLNQSRLINSLGN